MRYLGLDLGSKTLGLALSDSTGQIATPYEVIIYKTYEELLNKIKNIIEEHEIKEVIIGYPLNMNGSESKRSIETKNFKALLEKELKLKVHLQDERLSTMEAEKMLIKNDTARKKRKQIIDKLAASIILQTFLDKRSRTLWVK